MQARSLARFKTMGVVTCDKQRPDNPVVGIDLDRVATTWDDMSESTITDDDVAQIAHFSELESLDLSSSRMVTDSGIQHLTRLKKLRRLYLYETQLTDDGLASLELCPALEHVNVARTNVTQEGIDRFRNHKPQCQVSVWPLEKPERMPELD
jgi:hypothetical protein